MSRLSGPLEPLDESDLRELRALVNNAEDMLDGAEEFLDRLRQNLEVTKRKLAALDVIFESRHY